MERWEIMQGEYDNENIEALFDHLQIPYKPYNSFRNMKGNRVLTEPEDRKQSIVKLGKCYFTGYKQVAEYIGFSLIEFNKPKQFGKQ